MLKLFMQEIRTIQGVNNPPSLLEVYMSGIELFDSHDLFMKNVIWQSRFNGFFSFLVVDERKGETFLSTENGDLFQSAYGTSFMKGKDDYERCYIIKVVYA